MHGVYETFLIKIIATCSHSPLFWAHVILFLSMGATTLKALTQSLRPPFYNTKLFCSFLYISTAYGKTTRDYWLGTLVGYLFETEQPGYQRSSFFHQPEPRDR